MTTDQAKTTAPVDRTLVRPVDTDPYDDSITPERAEIIRNHNQRRRERPPKKEDRFAEGVKGHRPPRWRDAVALVKSGQVTVAEAAQLIGVSRQRVHRWVYKDKWRPGRGSEFRAHYLKALWLTPTRTNK